MWQFACWLLDWLGFAIVSVWTLLDFAARLIAGGIIARLAWRAKDDDDGTAAV